MLCRVSNMTMWRKSALPDRLSHALSPFCDWSRKLVDRPYDVWSTIRCQPSYHHPRRKSVQSNLRHTSRYGSSWHHFSSEFFELTVHSKTHLCLIVREESGCHPPVRGTSVWLLPDVSSNARAFPLQTAACPSRGFAAGSTLCTRKNLQTVSDAWFPLAGTPLPPGLARRSPTPWCSQLQTLGGLRKSVPSTKTGSCRRSRSPLRLSDPIGWSQCPWPPAWHSAWTWTDDCPECPQLIRDPLSHDTWCFTAPFDFWLISRGGVTRTSVLRSRAAAAASYLLLPGRCYPRLGSGELCRPQPLYVRIVVVGCRLADWDVLETPSSWLSGGSSLLTHSSIRLDPSASMADSMRRLHASEWFSGAWPVAWSRTSAAQRFAWCTPAWVQLLPPALSADAVAAHPLARPARWRPWWAPHLARSGHLQEALGLLPDSSTVSWCNSLLQRRSASRPGPRWTSTRPRYMPVFLLSSNFCLILFSATRR